MLRYVIQRTFEVGQDRMPEVGRRSRQIIEDEFPGRSVWEERSSPASPGARGLGRRQAGAEAGTPLPTRMPVSGSK